MNLSLSLTLSMAITSPSEPRPRPNTSRSPRLSLGLRFKRWRLLRHTWGVHEDLDAAWRREIWSWPIHAWPLEEKIKAPSSWVIAEDYEHGKLIQSDWSSWLSNKQSPAIHMVTALLRESGSAKKMVSKILEDHVWPDWNVWKGGTRFGLWLALFKDLLFDPHPEALRVFEQIVDNFHQHGHRFLGTQVLRGLLIESAMPQKDVLIPMGFPATKGPYRLPQDPLQWTSWVHVSRDFWLESSMSQTSTAWFVECLMASLHAYKDISLQDVKTCATLWEEIWNPPQAQLLLFELNPSDHPLLNLHLWKALEQTELTHAQLVLIEPWITCYLKYAKESKSEGVIQKIQDHPWLRQALPEYLMQKELRQLAEDALSKTLDVSSVKKRI